MKNDRDSYEQYFMNRSRYEREQIIFPITIIIGIVIFLWLFKFILIAVVATAVLALAVYLIFKRRLFSEQPIVLTKKQAREGAELRANIVYRSSSARVTVDIPAGVKDGERIIIKNVVFEDEKGKKSRKIVRLRIKIE